MGRPNHTIKSTWRCPCGQLYTLSRSPVANRPVFAPDGAPRYPVARCVNKRCRRDLRRTRRTVSRASSQIALFAAVLAVLTLVAGLTATSSQASNCLNMNGPASWYASTDVAVSIGDCFGGTHDPSYQGGHHIPGLRDTMLQAENSAVQAICNLFVDNIGWFLAIFTAFLAWRLAPALLSWFRHRNDPKQLSLL